MHMRKRLLLPGHASPLLCSVYYNLNTDGTASLSLRIHNHLPERCLVEIERRPARSVSFVLAGQPFVVRTGDELRVAVMRRFGFLRWRVASAAYVVHIDGAAFGYVLVPRSCKRVILDQQEDEQPELAPMLRDVRDALRSAEASPGAEEWW
jgi:hypothetical protein